MRAGALRTEADYVWPKALVAPPGDVRLVYLDLNHWINLAKAAVGHPDGARHQGTLERVREAKSSGSYAFPLSATHYMEMAGITDPRQRFDVAAVMEELSGFASLVCRTVVMRLELEAAIDAVAHPRPQAYAPVPVLGQGVLQAFGKRGGLRVRSGAGEDVTEAARLEWPDGPEDFDRWQSNAELQLDRSVLRGPTDAEAPTLRANGWDPTTARRTAEQRAAQEVEQAARLAAEPRWRRGRLRDVVSARYVIFELKEMLDEALAARGLQLEDVWRDPSQRGDWWTRCRARMSAYHSPPPWTANDVFDIDALSVAVPYCDVVVTERHARHTLRLSGAPARSGTVVTANLAELAAAMA